MRNRKYDIIQAALAKRGITQYKITENCGEGWLLPGSIEEVEVESGTIVTPDQAYYFWVGWANGDYTLGEEDGTWHELTAENESESSWQEIIQIQQQMRDDPEFGKREPLALPTHEPGKPTEREALIIWLALSPYFLDDSDIDSLGYGAGVPLFETFDVQSSRIDLVGSLLPGEVRDISGIVVVVHGAFHFRLSWVWGPENDLRHRNPGHYSLGEKDGSWHQVLREECTEEQWQRLETVRLRLEEELARLPRLEFPLWTPPDEEKEIANELSPAELRKKIEQRGERKPRTGRNLSEKRGLRKDKNS